MLYKATNKINGKCYIGQTMQDLEQRKAEHLSAAFSVKSKRYNCHFCRAIRKYGKESFEWEIFADGFPTDRLNNEEIAAISAHNSFSVNGYNSHSGGRSGGLMSEEVKRKISESHKGKIRSEEHKRKLSIAGKKREFSNEWHAKWKAQQGLKGTENHSYGKHPSQETLKKMSEIKKGKCLSSENKRKISEALIGIKRSDETRRKIGDSKKGNQYRLGCSLSKETRKKMSEARKRFCEANKGRVLSEEHKRNISIGLLKFRKANSEITAIS